MRRAWSKALQLELSEVDGYPCIRLAGEGECRGAELLEQALDHVIAQGHQKVILDTRDILFLDPVCYEVLASAIQRLEREGGLLVVVDQSLPVERTLKLLNLEQLVHVVPAVSQATTYLDWHE